MLPWSKQPKYQYGFCLCANVFLGMRAGELIALRWKDVDFNKGTIFVYENLQLVSNPSGSPRQIYEVQSLKNYQNRHIYMNEKARHYLEMQREHSQFTALADYVCCTRDGNHAAVALLMYAVVLIFILWRNRRKPQWNCWMILILDEYFCCMCDAGWADGFIHKGEMLFSIINENPSKYQFVVGFEEHESAASEIDSGILSRVRKLISDIAAYLEKSVPSFVYTICNKEGRKLNC